MMTKTDQAAENTTVTTRTTQDGTPRHLRYASQHASSHASHQDRWTAVELQNLLLGTNSIYVAGARQLDKWLAPGDGGDGLILRDNATSRYTSKKRLRDYDGL